MTPGRHYEFDHFRLDANGRLLFHDNERVQITPKAVDVLVALLEKNGAPITREDLLLKVWSDTAVEEGTLSSHISLLRKALQPGNYIETIPKRGYRFVGEVAASSVDQRRLLVVLPFANLSGAKANDAFSDGLTEEMITQLGRLNPAHLGVIARTSSMAYKSTTKTIEQIGRELGVSHVLEGSVRRARRRVRISAQLIQVSDQTHLWAENYEGGLEDILALQSRVSREVAREIQIHLLPIEERRLEDAKRIVPEAYEAYLRGRYLWNRRNLRDMHASLRQFQAAISADPAYPAPYAGMADVYLLQMDCGYLSPRDATAKARPLAFKALSIDPDLAEAHVTLGHAAFHEFDWRAAERHLLQGIELNPSFAIGHFYYSNYLVMSARLTDAIAEAEVARSLDPVSPAAHSNVAAILWMSRRYDDAIRESNKVLELDPNYLRAYENLSRAYEQIGAFGSAIKCHKRAIQLGGETPSALASLAHTYALAGREKSARNILRRLEAESNSPSASAFNCALIQTALGEDDAAFASLDAACDECAVGIPFLGVNARFDPLRKDRRFDELLRRVRLPRSA